MPGIDHCPWLGFGPELVTAEQLGEYRRLGHGRVQVQQCHGRGARDHQPRVGDGLGQHMG